MVSIAKSHSSTGPGSRVNPVQHGYPVGRSTTAVKPGFFGVRPGSPGNPAIEFGRTSWGKLARYGRKPHWSKFLAHGLAVPTVSSRGSAGESGPEKIPEPFAWRKPRRNVIPFPRRRGDGPSGPDPDCQRRFNSLRDSRSAHGLCGRTLQPDRRIGHVAEEINNQSLVLLRCHGQVRTDRARDFGSDRLKRYTYLSNFPELLLPRSPVREYESGGRNPPIPYLPPVLRLAGHCTGHGTRRVPGPPNRCRQDHKSGIRQSRPFAALSCPDRGRPRTRLLPDSPKACARSRCWPHYGDPHRSILSFWIKSKAKHITLERRASFILDPAAAIASARNRWFPINGWRRCGRQARGNHGVRNRDRG